MIPEPTPVTDSIRMEDVMFTGSKKAFGACPGIVRFWGRPLDRRKELETIPEYYVEFKKWIPVIENSAKYFATPAVNLV